MLKEGELAHASLNIVASVVCCILGTWLGIIAGNQL